VGLEKTIEKLDKYFKRLEQGKAAKIKTSHLRKVAEKLKAKERSLDAELEEAATAEKRQRLQRKLALVREQQNRVRWLETQLGD